MKALSWIASLAAIALLTSGCVSAVPFAVKHDRLQNPPATREGALAIKPFIDTRSVTNATQIGGKWQKAKPVYLAKQNCPVAGIVQDGFRESLEKVGYRIETSPTATTPVLEGELSEFWLTDDWGGAICKITVMARLRQGGQGTPLWEHRFHSEEDDWVIIPNAMTAAMNTLLKLAIEEFSKAQFAEAVAGPKPPR